MERAAFTVVVIISSLNRPYLPQMLRVTSLETRTLLSRSHATPRTVTRFSSIETMRPSTTMLPQVLWMILARTTDGPSM